MRKKNKKPSMKIYFHIQMKYKSENWLQMTKDYAGYAPKEIYKPVGTCYDNNYTYAFGEKLNYYRVNDKFHDPGSNVIPLNIYGFLNRNDDLS